MNSADILIGIDAGTSVIKSVAFDTRGRQIAVASVRNEYRTGAGGMATQDMVRTWCDCAQSLRVLAEKVPGLAERTLAVSVTAQGDGTWLVDAENRAFTDAWIWLDARAAPTVRDLNGSYLSRKRFEATGTGLNACQQGSQLAHMAKHEPALLARADCAMHCKDWLYLNLTGVRATDPSEACFTFGNFRTRRYEDSVIEALGLTAHRSLLPDIVDGSQVAHPLSVEAARMTGLKAGTPVSLAYVDMVMTALGAGVHTGEEGVACSVIGSTGVHMRSVAADRVYLNPEGTGYVIALPIPGRVTQVQSNMAATLNLDWLLNLAADLLTSAGLTSNLSDLVPKVDQWLAQSPTGQLLYHPYISEAGERGPFVDAHARASFVGLSYQHRFPDLVRAVVEGLGMAMRDCYNAMGPLPNELRLSGGAARSPQIRAILAASLGASVRVSAREEAGAAGAAMMAAVANGIYDSMDACIADWVSPLLGDVEAAKAELTSRYSDLFTEYREVRESLSGVWGRLVSQQHPSSSEYSKSQVSDSDQRSASELKGAKE
ncbi:MULTISPECIES: FGGY-family carbohydrate kinase [Zobellella]|uniref:Xylulose kinase n=1 Tax=Zobellella denitrificans TaxID=347534 RepID=A0A291HNR6_9GAMM|nr:FGGY-family carbohydrate kinase [Zobellella denitrificans]ATG73807.1 xylulose kinase [Zobellella denitrificans]